METGKPNHPQEHLKYLEMLQSNIARMHDASMSMKRYAIVSFALAAAASRYLKAPDSVLFVAFAVCVFWFMDAKYLDMERAFRKLYAKAAAVGEKTWNHSRPAFDLTPQLPGKWPACGFKSWSTSPLYGAMLAMLVIMRLTWP